MTARATTPTSNVDGLRAPKTADPRSELLPRVHAVGGGSGELGQFADDDVDGGAGKEAGHDRPGEEARKPSELQDRHQQEQGTGRDRDRRDELRRVAVPVRPVTRTAPPATAASEELGPVEMWRDVQKIP